MIAINELLNKLPDGFDTNPLDGFQKTKIVVLDGAHRGTELRFPNGPLKIGAAADNDLILFADDLQPHHCALHINANLFAKMRIDAIDGPVLVGNTIVEPGEYVLVRRDSNITIGGAQISVQRGIEAVSFREPVIKAGIAAAFVGMIFVGTNLTGSLMTRTSGFGGKVMGAVTNFASGIKAPLGLGSDAKSKKAAEEAIVASRKKLGDLGLSASMRIATLPDNSMRVFGSVSPQHSGAWNNFLRWYDNNADFPKLVRDVVRTGANPEIPKLESVWLGKRPMAHFAGSGPAYVGTELPGNWRVTGISANHVSINRDDSPVKLSF